MRWFDLVPIVPSSLLITSTQLTDGVFWNHEHFAASTTEAECRRQRHGQNASAELAGLDADRASPVSPLAIEATS